MLPSPPVPVLVHEYEANMLNGEAHWVPPGGFASRFAHWVGALPAEPVQASSVGCGCYSLMTHMPAMPQLDDDPWASC